MISGLSVEGYDQEVERYGGPDSIEAAENVFHTDSRLVLATFKATHDPDERLVVAALSAATIARSVADDDLAAVDGRHLDRSARRRFVQLRAQVRTAAGADLDMIPLRDPAWADREAALAAYRNTLPRMRRSDCASSLIHMHTNRLLGERDEERLVRALAADLLAREAAR